MAGMADCHVWLSWRPGWARSGRGLGGCRFTVGNATPRPVALRLEEKFPLSSSGGLGLAERRRLMVKRQSVVEREGGSRGVVKALRGFVLHLIVVAFVGDHGMWIPLVGLPVDVATAEHIATSEKALSQHVVTVTWDPQPRASVRGSSPSGGRDQVANLEQKGKTVGQQRRVICRALLDGSGTPRLCGARSTPNYYFGNPFLGAIVVAPTLLLTWLFGLSRGDTWLFLPGLVEVQDVGACVVRLWSLVVAPVFLASACVDSASSAGVVFGLTRVVVEAVAALAGKGLVIFTEPCSRGSPPYSLQVANFPAGSECVAAAAGGACCEHGCYFARAVVGFVLRLRVRLFWACFCRLLCYLRVELFGLCSGDGFQTGSWRFGWRFPPK
ncbi:hypothetical protein Taro_014752, partial [Colocasia esculenta]|nr:hypothetical protein [Colocasia esculenta]